MVRGSFGLGVAPLRVVVVGDASLVERLGELPQRLVATAATAHLDVSVRFAQADAVVIDAGPAGTRLGQVASAPQGVPVLVLMPGDVLPAIAAGASGAIHRDSPVEVVAAAVHALHEGLAVFDRAFVSTLGQSTPAEVAAELEAQVPPGTPVGPGVESSLLTAREREVLTLLADGRSNKQIAGQLTISEHTAKFHVNSIMQKLSAEKRVEAVVRAAKLGLIDL